MNAQRLNTRYCFFLFILQTGCYASIGSSSGTSGKFDGFCDLNHNQYNQYIFLILWYWFILLFVIGLLQLIFEAVCVLVPAFRFTLLRWKLPKGSTVNLEQFTLDQWFLLFQISRNMQKHFFYEFLQRVSDENYEQKANEEATALKQMDNEEV